MKVKQLIKQLQKVNPNFEVVLSKDGEGNSFSPASDIGVYAYTPDNTWSGEIRDLDDELEEDEDKPVANAIVIWPTN